MSFKNKTVIVTGASSGVGAACAKMFASNGANVVIAARSKGALDVLAKELGDKVFAHATDVSSLEACRLLIATTVEKFGGVDVLVNNAGFNSRGDVFDVSVEDMDQIIDVNLKGPMRLSRLALPYLLKSAHGSIVNVASLAGRFPLDGEASYSSSKFGLRAFSLALAEELRETAVSVSIVSPGPIETGFILDDIDEVPDLVFSQPMSTAEEVAENVLRSADDGKQERAMPAASGILATTGYLFPSLRRVMKPVLEAQGKRAKARYMSRR